MEREQRQAGPRTAVDPVESFTESQRRAWRALISGQNVFLSGNAGTGKTFLLNAFIDHLQEAGRSFLCCAPSGKAAQNLPGGVTLHRAFGIPTRILAPGEGSETFATSKEKDEYGNKVKLPPRWVREADVIIIDEISMCRVDVFEYVVQCIAKAERCHPYRMKQLVVVGDFFQLPPVITRREAGDMKRMYADSPHGYCFQSDTWDACDFVHCDLREVVRQTDDAFIGQLNRARVGDPSCLPYFNSLVGRPDPDDEVRWIHLFGRNADADRWNSRALDAIDAPVHTFRLETDGKVNNGDKVAPEILDLKVGARVMLLVNDTDEGLYSNGSTATVLEIDDMRDEVVLDVDGVEEPVRIGRYKWTVEMPSVAKGDDGSYRVETIPVGTYSQIPLKLGYAITIHKSQGQTYNRVVLSPDCFDNGQLYVALSRAVSADGLYLMKPIPPSALMCAGEVVEFYRSFGDGDEALVRDETPVLIKVPAFLADAVRDYAARLERQASA